MNYANNINNWFANFEHRNNSVVPNIVAETAAEYYKERFKFQNWDNVPWQPLNPKYAAKKTKGRGRILFATSNLQASIRPTTVNQARVVISAGSTKVPYARVHNEGLRVVGNFKVKEFTNNNFMGTGRRQLIKSHIRRVNYKMPKRQFIGHSRFVNARIRSRLIKHFNS